MSRKASFDDATMTVAVAQLVSTVGSVRMADLTANTGVSIGSIYHRYSNREGLLATVWLRALRYFHSSYFDALSGGDWEAGLAAVKSVPAFCRSKPHEATLLACCRRNEFINEATPQSLSAAIEEANRQAFFRLDAFVNNLAVDRLVARTMLVDWPLAAVKPWLPDQRVPTAVDAMLETAYRALVPATV